MKARSGRQSALWTVDCHPPGAWRLEADESPRSERWIVIHREHEGSKRTRVRALNGGLSSTGSMKARSGRQSAFWRRIVIRRERKGSKWTKVRALNGGLSSTGSMKARSGRKSALWRWIVIRRKH